jgi:Holliday junction resolvase RusA-like endonuclease
VVVSGGPEWTLTVPGLPVAQPRHRATQGGRLYLPTSHPVHAYKAAVIRECQDRGPTEPLTGAVRVVLRFAFPRPSSHYGSGRNAGALRGQAPLHYVQKPDLDNLTKAAMDALTQAGAWRDDAQVVQVNAAKAWADHDQMPHTTIRIEVC